MNAYLELLVGPMYSGKSTMLIQRAERFERQKKHVLYVKYAQDNRYSADSISTHQLVMKPALLVQDLTEVIDHIQALYVDVVVIDEGQFIKNIDLADELVAKHKKVVIIAALDADFKREPFRHITDLIAKAERVQKLTAVCAECSSDAAFSHRTVQSDVRELIGSCGMYSALCRSCYDRATGVDVKQIQPK